MIQDKQWLLSVGVFLPLAGVLVMLFIPKKDEASAKGVAIITAALTLVVGVYMLLQFDYDQSEKLQFFTDQGHLHGGSRRHQPAAVHPVDGDHVIGDDLLLGSRPEPG